MTTDDLGAENDRAARGPKASTSLIGGAGVLIGGRLAGAALSWTGTVLIARELGIQGFGSFSFIFNLLGLLGLFADFETTRVVMTELGRTGDDELSSIASRFIVFRFALGSVTYLAALAIVWIGPYSSVEIQGVAIGGLSLLIASAAWSLISVCQAKQWLRTVAAAMFAGQVLQFIVILALHGSGSGSLLRYIVPFVLSDVVVFFVILAVIRRSVRVRPRIDFSSWRRWLVEAAPLAVGSALGALYYRIDSLMLTLVLDDPVQSRAAVGLYQIGYKFADLVAFLAPALIAAMLPALVRSWPRDPAGFHRTVRQGIIVVSIASAFAIVAFAVFADSIITNVIAVGFRSAQTPARWLVVGQVLNLFTQIVYVCLITANRRRFYPVVMLSGLVINVGLNLMFIPRYGVNGSAAATVITEVIVLALLIGQVVDLPLRPLPTHSIMVAISAALVSGGIGALLLRRIPWTLAGVVTLLLYPALLHIWKVDGPGGLRGLFERSRFVDSDGFR